MKKEHLEFTRYVRVNLAQLRILLKQIFDREDIPDRIDSILVDDDKLVLKGKTYLQPVRLEVKKSLLTLAAQQEGLLSKEEYVTGFSWLEDGIQLLVALDTPEEDEKEITVNVRKVDSAEGLSLPTCLLYFFVVFLGLGTVVGLTYLFVHWWLKG